VHGESASHRNRGDPDGTLSIGSNSHASVASGLPRGIEAAAALVGLIVFSPVIALGAAAVAMTSGGPVFFRQTRVGRGGRPFTLVKLRTMRSSRGAPEVTAGGDARVTPVGRFLRHTKLDELPQLWNVLKGEMGLVGPRPEVPRYVQDDNPLWQVVLRARPGLTDPVTLRLRHEEALLARVEGDREHYYLETLQPLKLRGYAAYLEVRTWRSDVRVIWDTILAILRIRADPPALDVSDRPPET
jgi:lipopolysaccharide/colanic/teichoic acid biosynthesis glycosyltransferase